MRFGAPLLAFTFKRARCFSRFEPRGSAEALKALG